MEFLVALIELRVLVVVGMINLPGEGGTLEFFIRGCAHHKKTFSLLQNFPLKTIPCTRRYLCKVYPVK